MTDAAQNSTEPGRAPAGTPEAHAHGAPGAVAGAVVLSLLLAWINFLTTARWADQPGALHGWRKPWYAAALLAASALSAISWRQMGRPVRLGRTAASACVAGAGVLVGSLLCRLPPSSWAQIPFKDDWTELFVQASNGVALLRRGVVVGWNWYFLGGYPTSTDIAQNFGAVAFVPMTLLGDRIGYHVYHVVLFLAVPVFVWWDLRHEDEETGWLAAAFACVFAAGYLGTIGSSGDTNSLTGVCCAGVALVGSRAAGLGRWWGGPLLLTGLTLALYSHQAFFVYAGLYLALEAAWFRDRRAFERLVVAGVLAVVAALPMHWESLRYPGYVSFNNTVYDPAAPIRWGAVAKNVYYNVEILLRPSRWFNDYRSLANVWLPVLVFTAWRAGRTRVGFFAACAVLTQVLLRFNTPSVGAGFDRIQHMLPLVAAPALAGFVMRWAGTRRTAAAIALAIGLYVQTAWAPIRHVEELRAFDPPLVDRIRQSDGALVLVEVSPHRDMDSSRTHRSPTTPFDVHWEGLLPGPGGQRYYSQMIDGWVFSTWRGQVVGAGTFAGHALAETPPAAFVAEMRRWGVRHLFVWADDTRAYLSASGRFVERWREGRWSQFELPGVDTRAVVAPTGTGRLTHLDALGADVELDGVAAGEPIVIRANYYPAWTARAGVTEVPLWSSTGQMAFRAPRGGSYTVRLEYPRYRALSLLAVATFLFGLALLARWPRRREP